jgi:hypothetical protein
VQTYSSTRSLCSIKCSNSRGGVPGVDIMAKGSQWWVQWEDHLPCYKAAVPRVLSMMSSTNSQQRRSKNLAVGGSEGRFLRIWFVERALLLKP